MNYFELPLENWTNWFVDNWFLPHFGGVFDGLGSFVGFILDDFTTFLLWIPPEILTIVLIIIAWRLSNYKIAIFTLIGMFYLGSVDLWYESMQTLAIVLISTILSIIIGIPLGIWSAKSDRVDNFVRPILDFMQTLPSFVYLIPVILLLGIGGVSAVFATFIYATPPAVRMTNLAIRQVPFDVIEAALAFGSTSWQLLRKVQLPLAVPTIMAGINQTIMMALSMAVIAAMIGAPGLGATVLAGINNVNVGLGLVGGLGIVILAIFLDRVTEGIGKK